MKLEFLDIVSKKFQYQISRKSIQWETRCSTWGGADGLRDRHEEAKRLSSQFRERAEKCYKISHAVFVRQLLHLGCNAGSMRPGRLERE